MVTNTEIFLGSYAHLTFVPEVDLYIKKTTAETPLNVITLHANLSDLIHLVDDLYIGCIIDRYAADGTFEESHMITDNDSTTITFSPSVTVLAADDYFIIKSYGAPCFGEKSSSTVRLNADNWLGLIESATFPNIETELKQVNLQLGGSRNWSHQYKGIRTSSGGNIGVISNHGAWLYYAFGQCTNVNCSFIGYPPASDFIGDAVNLVYIDSNNAGPIFYRSGRTNKTMLPPALKGSDLYTNLEQVIRTTCDATSVTNAITYTFEELNTANLPSFALEQTFAKSNTLTTETGSASESHTFVRIARGNRVASLTMTANENEELKMTMDLNTRIVDKLKQGQNYEARGGQATNTSLFNFASSSAAELLEPFFFSGGSFSIYGEEFLKITNFTLTITNDLQDKRFIGTGSKNIKEAIPAQRSYEISFTALVTDDKLFEETFTETETDDTTATLISLQFDKANEEQIVLKFQDYHIESSNWTVPDDKGPITVEAMVKPRNLKTCTVKTHWVLQG